MMSEDRGSLIEVQDALAASQRVGHPRYVQRIAVKEDRHQRGAGEAPRGCSDTLPAQPVPSGLATGPLGT